jgi:antitoxin component of RelBE/YafQ-DinJ toxin-antitoxin module
MTTQFMFKIDPKIKKAAMKKAKEKGITFSAFLIFATIAFVEGRLDIGLIVKEKPNQRTQKIIQKAKNDFRRGKNISPAFSNAKDMDKYLNSFK